MYTAVSLPLCLGGILVFTNYFSLSPFFASQGSIPHFGPAARKLDRLSGGEIRNKKIHGSREEFGVFFCFSRWSPIGILAGDFAMDFGIGRVAQQTSRHVVEGGRSPRRKQSLDASSRSSWDDETRGPGLPGVTPTGRQNPCTHRISEFWFPDFLQQIAGLDLHGVQVSPLVWPQILELQNLQIHGRCCQSRWSPWWLGYQWMAMFQQLQPGMCRKSAQSHEAKASHLHKPAFAVANCGRPHAWPWGGSRGGTGSFFLMQPQRYEQWHSGSLPS